MRTNAEYEFPDQIMVQVALERYEELLRKAEHYDNIVNIAIDGAYIPSWSKDKDISLDTGTIDKYLRIVESGKLAGVKYRLQQRLEDEKLMNYKPEGPSERMDKTLDYIDGWNEALEEAMCHAPTIEAEPTKHERWEIVYYDNVPTLAYCSRCDQVLQLTRGTETMPNYCPNCGARMDEVKE